MTVQIVERLIEVGDCRSWVLQAGEGPQVVLIPSMLVLAKSYRETMLELVYRGFSVTIVEAPGSGRSSHLRRGWSFDHYGAWCQQMLETLDVQDATLIAHSNSGPVAVIGATRAPQRVARLVLADIVGADEKHSLIRILAGRALDAILEPILSVTRWHHVIINVLRHTQNFWHQVKACAAYDGAAASRQVTQPVLLAWGRLDHTTPRRCLKTLQSLLPQPATYLSPTGSHDWIITRAPEFARAVEAFYRADVARLQSSIQ